MSLYNTLSKKKEEFIPGEPGKVKMYVCGPTTYNYIHLGNARPLVVFDSVRRYFEYRGFEVTYVQNFTDIDDKIIKRAQEEGEDALRLAQRYIQEYYRDADALRVRRADVHPQVSSHLPEIIEMITTLVAKGHAYAVGGDVYFDVRSFPEYGKLSGRSLDELMVGARVEVDTRKKDPLDFALWKAPKPGEPAWDSPWGGGRPGWHIECSAMSLKYLGTGFDIHGGGLDLVFPHHENEIAQAEAATGRPFARYWMHNGFITVNQEKMSKSLGNFFLLRDILAKFPPDVVRFYLLSTHYRSPLDFDDGKLEAAGKGLERLKKTLRLLEEALSRPVTPSGSINNTGNELAASLHKAQTAFEEAMDDDFNTSLAIAALFDLSRDVNSFIYGDGFALTEDSSRVLQEARSLFQRLGGDVLGVLGAGEAMGGGDEYNLVEQLMSLIIEMRQEARKKKDWAVADGIRERLKALGIALEDTPHGVRWKRQ
ncbi:cysteinyl-tRNA synthetase [Clostridiales bacterium PH28_bin88]|nr:cysteinyl-tRNA synthetase [Clostridiales bacterium PH28_bin88]